MSGFHGSVPSPQSDVDSQRLYTSPSPVGDENDQITLTTCEPVANASDIDPKTLKRPIWLVFALQMILITPFPLPFVLTPFVSSVFNRARTFSTHSWEVLIGKKTDPFCFQTFPGNSSEGALCYRPQTGVQTYEFQKARAIREDLTLKTPVGNITTTVLHQGRNFWVVNKLPWYAAGVHQCICTQA